MKHAIAQLQIALEVVATNEPINRAAGNIDQARLEWLTACDIRQAIQVLEAALPRPTDLSPLTLEQTAWRDAYIAQLAQRGVPSESAWAMFEGGDHDFEDDPVEAADAETSYMVDG